jgi:predicted dehydrogenase
VFYSDGEPEVIVSEVGGYRHFYEATAKAIRGEGPLPVTIRDALNGLNIIKLAEKSSSEGRTLPVPDVNY